MHKNTTRKQFSGHALHMHAPSFPSSDMTRYHESCDKHELHSHLELTHPQRMGPCRTMVQQPTWFVQIMRTRVEMRAYACSTVTSFAYSLLMCLMNSCTCVFQMLDEHPLPCLRMVMGICRCISHARLAVVSVSLWNHTVIFGMHRWCLCPSL